MGFRESHPQRGDDFASPLSAFATISFEGIFPGPRPASNLRREEKETTSNLSKDDFVGVILDVLKMQKNVCLCRHFQVRLMWFRLRSQTKCRGFISRWLLSFF